MKIFQINEVGRFKGDFFVSVLQSQPQPTIEQRYVDKLNEFLTQIAKDYTIDATKSDRPSVQSELETLRLNITKNLRESASKFVEEEDPSKRETSASEAREKIFYYEGAYTERRRTILRRAFEVLPSPRKPDGTPDGLLDDIDISISDVAISDAQQKFKVDIDSTIRVMKVVLSEQPLLRALGWSRFWKPRSATARKQRLSKYLLALQGIARVGLMNQDPTQIPFASLALKGLQQEFVDNEAGRVKNSYVGRLGRNALILAFIGVFGFFAIGHFARIYPSDFMDIFFQFRRFFLLAAGSAVGTWLSFCLRRVKLSFEDLAVLEDDRLSPSIRIIFVMWLTVVVGLLFWTHAITVKLGNFSSDFQMSGTSAFLIGALCGIAERGLATAVTKRADDFAASIGNRV